MVLLQEVNSKQAVKFTSVSSGYKITTKTSATHSVKAASGEGRTADEGKQMV